MYVSIEGEIMDEGKADNTIAPPGTSLLAYMDQVNKQREKTHREYILYKKKGGYNEDKLPQM
jgi:hypothetical protein